MSKGVGKFRHYKLDNGLVVALQDTPTQTVSAKLRVNYGAVHQRPGEEGMAHFLEHCLVTSGSRKYDPIQADSIRGNFGMSNAFTNIGRTCIVGGVLSEDLETWLDYTADHVFNPRFDKDRVDGERGRVLREISDKKSGPGYLRGREVSEKLYGDHPAGIFVLGSEEVVGSADLEKIVGFHSRGYGANNMDLLISGGLPKNTEELIDKYFGEGKITEDTRIKFPYLRPMNGVTVVHQSVPEGRNNERPEESSAQLAIDFNIPSGKHEDTYALMTLSNILGVGTNSLLFQNVSLGKGLAYYINSGLYDSYNAGLFSIVASVPSVRREEAVAAIFDEFDRMKSNIMPNDGVQRVKKAAQYAVAKNFETNEGHVGSMETMLDEGTSPEDFIAGFDRVTAEKVRECARRYFPDRKDGNYFMVIQDPLK